MLVEQNRMLFVGADPRVLCGWRRRLITEHLEMFVAVLIL